MSTLNLEPVVESTPVARHWIAAHLRGLPSEVTGYAALLTSELVTNAVLHAATPMCVTLHILSDRIRVDVADGNPAFPSLKEYGRDAATGRGLTLFNSLASNWGVQAVDGGKIVWFELPVDFPVSPTHVSDGSFRFDLAGITHPGLHGESDESPDIEVRLLGIPVALLQKSSEEYEALFRELRLMKERADSTPSAPALPERLSVLVSEIGTRFNGLGPGMDEMWQRRGRQSHRSLRLDSRAPAVRRRRLRILRRDAGRGRRVRAVGTAADAAGVADQRRGAPVVPLRAHRPTAREGPRRVARQPVPRRIAGGDRPLSPADQRALVVALFSTLP